MSMTVDIDVTALVRFVHAHGLKFYPAMMWVVSKAINQREEFKYGWDKEGNLIHWDYISPYYADFHKDDEQFVKLVTEYSDVLQWEILLPDDWEGFTASAGNFFALLINGENFVSYWSAVGNVMLVAAKVIAILLPCVIVLILVIYRMYRQGNTKHNQDTKPLKAFKWLAAKTYQPLKRAVLSYREYLSGHRGIWVCWIVLWAFHLNLASIVISFFAVMPRLEFV